MAAALAQVCVDPRLNHELLRIQVRQKLQRLRVAADRIYILNDVGGNVGMNFRNTVNLLSSLEEPIVLCGVLHHDDCLSGQQGIRTPLDASAQEMATYLADRNIRCPVLTGTIRIDNNHLLWADEPEPRSELLVFRMPRL
ncbi:MAG TPA: hypothetical protein VGL70_08150 [Candidatus Binatia bacterium]|jgi:hypothetical protein